MALVGGCIYNVSFDTMTPFAGPDANGETIVPMPLSVALTGLSLASQAIELDALAPSGFAVSAGLAANAAPGCATNAELVTAVLGYGETDARAAYEELFARGPAVIPAVLAALVSMPPSQPDVCGAIPHHELSSIYIRCLDARLVLCYLLESLYRDNITPWGAPDLLSTSPLFSVDKSIVISEYIAWASTLSSFTPSAVAASPDPLQNTRFAWVGTSLPDVSGDSATLGDLPWTEDGPTTPIGKGIWPPLILGPPLTQMPGAWLPPTPEGIVPPRKPYNCFAWAQACHEDRWVMPPPPESAAAPKTGLDEIFPGKKSAPQPGPGQSCIKIVHMAWLPKDFVGQPEAWINDCTATHAMKTTDGGVTYSSKNGEGKRYKDITDCDAFLDTFYPVQDFCIERDGVQFQQHRVVEYRCDC